MRPAVRIEGGRLSIRDDRQPRNTLYRIELDLARPLTAKISLTNGELKAEDRLDGLELSATNGEARLEGYRPTAPPAST